VARYGHAAGLFFTPSIWSTCARQPHLRSHVNFHMRTWSSTS